MATSKMSTHPVQRFGEDLINCTICFDNFQDAKVLPCLHSFCQSCISRHYEVYRLKNGNRLSCPTCRELLPVPGKGIAGLRNDNTIAKTKELLDQVCLEWTAAGYSDQDDSRLGACALPPIDFEQLEWKRKDLKDITFSCQHALSKLRSKMMNLYLVENHVKYTIDAECKALTEAKQAKGKAQLNANRLDLVRESHAVSLAQLATEQDRLYQQLEELRSVNDVIEEVLDKANPYQIQSAYGILKQFGQGVTPLLEKTTPSHVNKSGHDAADMSSQYLQELGLPPGSEAKLFNIRPPPEADLRPVQKDKRKGDKIRFKPILKLSGRGPEPGMLDFPVDATLMPDGSIAVCDKNNCRIQIFDEKGNLVQICLRDEVKPRRMRLSPRDGCWYVSDELSECVKVYSPNWRLIRRIGESTFQCPAGLAIDSKGNLVMTDAEKNFVSIHNPSNGDLLNKFYFQFLSDKRIACPYFACVNEDDQLIVSDMRNNQVKIFSQSGKVLFRIRGLCCPRGVCVDPYGNILVAEGDRHCVSMYSPHGKFLQRVLTKDDGLCFPMALDMDMTGRLLVTQWGFYTPHEVLVFQMC